MCTSDNINSFHVGQVLTRTERSHSGRGYDDGSYMGDPMIYLGVKNNQIILERLSNRDIFTNRLIDLPVGEWSNGWALYQNPNTLINANLIKNMVSRIPDASERKILARELIKQIDPDLLEEMDEMDTISEKLHEAMACVAIQNIVNDIDEMLSEFLDDDNELNEDTEVIMNTQKNLTTYEIDYQLDKEDAEELSDIICGYLRNLSLKKG